MNGEKLFDYSDLKKGLISIVLAFIILYLIFSNIDLQKSYKILINANFFVILLSFFFHYLTIPIRAIRWSLQLETVGFRQSILNLTKVIFFAQFFNGILPAKLGELYRAHTLKKNYNLSISENLGVIFVERIIDVIILILLTIFSAYSVFGSKVPFIVKNSILVTSILMITGTAIILSLKFNYLNLSKILPSIFIEKLNTFTKSAKLPTNIIIPLFSYSFSIWLLEIITLYLCALALGYPINVWLAVFVTLASSLLTAVPITPAGTGAVEFGVLGIFSIVGIEPSLAFSIMMLFRVVSYWSHIVFGFMGYVFTKDYNI